MVLMDWSSFSGYITLLGGLNALVLAILIIIATQYRYFFSPSKKTAKKSPLPETKGSEKSKTVTKEETLKKLGYTEESLKEIARCAMILQNHEPPTNQSGGDEAKRFKINLPKPMTCPFTPKTCMRSALFSQRTNEPYSRKEPSVQEQLKNEPNNQDQDDVDISDLVPDDIAIQEDIEEDDDHALISPQAIADIEAEMLDSSILTESLDDGVVEDQQNEEGITERDGSGRNMEEVYEDAASHVAGSAVLMALSELGMECLIKDLNEEFVSDEEDFEEATDAGIEEEVIGEGGMNRKMLFEEEMLSTVEGHGDSVGIAKKVLISCCDDENPVDAEIGRQNYCEGENMREGASEVLDFESEPVRAESQGKDAKQELKLHINQMESGDGWTNVEEKKDDHVNIDLDQDDTVVDLPTDTSHAAARVFIDEILEELFNEALETYLQQTLELSIPEKIEYKYNQVCDSRSEVFCSASNLVADYVARQAIFAAVEDLRNIEKETRIRNAAGINAANITKIQSETKKLSEDEIAEERRIQQTQLSKIFTLMQANPDMFGEITQDQLKDQASLYCI